MRWSATVWSSVCFLALVIVGLNGCLESEVIPERPNFDDVSLPAVELNKDVDGAPVITWTAPNFPHLYAEIEAQTFDGTSWGEWTYSGEEESPTTTHLPGPTEGTLRYRVRWSDEDNSTQWSVSRSVDFSEPVTPIVPIDPIGQVEVDNLIQQINELARDVLEVHERLREQSGEQQGLGEELGAQTGLLRAAETLSDAIIDTESTIHDLIGELEFLEEITPAQRETYEGLLSTLSPSVERHATTVSDLTQDLAVAGDLSSQGSDLNDSLSTIESEMSTHESDHAELRQALADLFADGQTDESMEQTIRATLDQVGDHLDLIKTALSDDQADLDSMVQDIAELDVPSDVANDLDTFIQDVQSALEEATQMLADLPIQRDPEPIDPPEEPRVVRPETPTEFTAVSRSNGRIRFSWTYPGENPDRFVIKAQKKVDNNWADWREINVNQGRSRGHTLEVNANAKLRFKIRAEAGEQASRLSRSWTQVDARKPAEVRQLTVQSRRVGGARITWSYPRTAADVQKFEIERKRRRNDGWSDWGGRGHVDGDKSRKDDELARSGRFKYRIRAVNHFGHSRWVVTDASDLNASR